MVSEHTAYYASGHIHAVYNIDDNNRRHGPYRMYRPDGKTVQVSAHYSHGVLHGRCISYNVEGTVSMYPISPTETTTALRKYTTKTAHLNIGSIIYITQLSRKKYTASKTYTI